MPAAYAGPRHKRCDRIVLYCGDRVPEQFCQVALRRCLDRLYHQALPVAGSRLCQTDIKARRRAVARIAVRSRYGDADKIIAL